MELSRAGADLFGATEAGALRVLARAAEPVSMREVARRAQASPSSTRRALQRLAHAGLVLARPSSHAVLFSANRDHLLWRPVEEILSAPARFEAELIDLVNRTGEAVTLAVFGSVARGEATIDSDVDLLLLTSEDSAADMDDLVDALTELVQRRTGNAAQIVTLTQRQLNLMVAGDDPLIASLIADARTLAGPPLAGAIARATHKPKGS